MACLSRDNPLRWRSKGQLVNASEGWRQRLKLITEEVRLAQKPCKGAGRHLIRLVTDLPAQIAEILIIDVRELALKEPLLRRVADTLTIAATELVLEREE